MWGQTSASLVHSAIIRRLGVWILQSTSSILQQEAEPNTAPYVAWRCMSEWSPGKNKVLTARSAWVFMLMGEMVTCGAKLLLGGGDFFCASVLNVFSGQRKGRNREKTYDYQSVAAFQDPLISSWSWNKYSSGTALWLVNKPQPVLASSTSSLSPSKDMFPTPLSIEGAKLGYGVTTYCPFLSRFSNFFEQKIGIVEISRQPWDSVSVSMCK